MARDMRQRPRVETNPIENWKPKTALGRKVQNKQVTDIDAILDEGATILESEIVDTLLPNLETDTLLIGQAKGKFGGGQRRVFKNTQKKTREGNKPKFTVMAVVGDRNGHVGIGLGSSKETVPAREKAIRKAKINVFKISRGSGSWESKGVKEAHSIPFAIYGKSGSVEVRLMPAPKGKGLCAEKEVAKVLGLAGVKDIWSKSRGQTRNKMNMIKALENALHQLSTMKLQPSHVEELSVLSGSKKVESGLGK